MLTVHHLTKSYNLNILFEDVSFSLNPGECTGLIGPNGCGKTTLMRILTGEEKPDSGVVTYPPNLNIGYLPQGFEPDPTLKLWEIIGAIAGEIRSLEQELEFAAKDLVNHPENQDFQLKYDGLLRQIENAELGKTAEIISRLGLGGLDPEMQVAHLSGGQKTRLSLALILITNPDLLLLDEPTNHLDIEMLVWLENWINQYPGAVLIVSHDRTFLDNTVSSILDMDPISYKVTQYPGNFTDYLSQKQVEINHQWRAYNDQQSEIRRMKQDIARVRAQAEYTERQASSIRIGGGDFKIKGYKSYQQGIAKKVAKKAKSRENKLNRYLDADERVDKPQKSWTLKLNFDRTQHLGKTVIQLEEVSIGYHLEKPLLNNISLDVKAGQRIALTGANGSGKTTLLRTLIGEIKPLAGEVHLGSSVRLGYMSQDQSGLDLRLSPLEVIESYFPTHTEARNFLAFFMFTEDEPLKPLQVLSYGQKARLVLAKLVLDGCNCLLLDEPINHLDIPSRSQFEQALAQFDGAVLAVVHDRYFIDRFADEVWWIEGNRIKRL
jgi:ATP-binding cassette subfamily F protein 3